MALTADFELGVNGNDVLVADPGSANAWDTRIVPGGTVKYSNTQKAHGALSAQFDHTASGSAKTLQWDTSLGTVTDHYGRFYMFVTAYPTGDTFILDANTVGVTNNARIRLLTTGALSTFSKSALLNTTTNLVPLNGWCRIEYHIVHSATVGMVELKLFNTMDSAVATETITSAANNDTNANANGILYGSPDGTGGAWIQYLDDIVANATSYPGPVSTPAATVILPSWTRTRFNG